MTYPEPPIILDLDPSGYVTGLGQAERQTDQFAGTLRSAAIAMGPMQRGLDAITPSRVTMAGMAGVTALAAKQQQALSGLAASSKVTGTNFAQMNNGMRQLAREFPIGNRGALEMVTTINRLGIVSTGSNKQIGATSKAVQEVSKAYAGWDKSLDGVLPNIGKVSGALSKFTGVIDKVTGTSTGGSIGAEKRVIDLGKAFTKLSGATGENAGGLASGMIQLSRSMGSALSTERITKMNDSLTTLSMQSGASATGILSFSKAIAPLAQASGIGQTSVMGISTAFSKLGEDGFGAANAFNKMLGDMHRSVREGTPQMAAYAQIVGKTTGEFQQLFKANPTEAMIQVVESIGSSGNAPRLLEQVGLEGTRTARYLTNLAQSGNVRGEIARAQDAYGNGMTDVAANTAFGGLVDSATRAKDNLSQFAEALGRPMLGTLTGFSNMVGAAITPMRELVDNKYFQGLGQLVAPLALGALAFTKLVSPALSASGIGQMATSGPVRGFLAGYAGSGAPGSERIAGWGGVRRFNERLEAGEDVGVGRMDRINRGANTRGAGFGRFVQGTTAGVGPSILRQGFGAAVLAAAVYGNMGADQMRQTRTPAWDRQSQIASYNPATREFMSRRAGLRDDLSTGMIDRNQYNSQMRAAFQNMIASAGGTRAAFSMLSGSAANLSKQLLLTGASAARRGASSLLQNVGGPWGAALMAGVGGIMIQQGVARGRGEAADEARNSVGFVDELRTAMGKAADATNTFAGSMAAAAKAANSAPQTRAQAAEFDRREYERARASGVKPTDNYAGGAKRTAQRLRMAAGTSGLAPDEINRIQQDLANSGYSESEIREITKGIGTGEPNLRTDRTGDIRSSAQSIAGMGRDRGMFGWKSAANVLGRQFSNPFGGDELSSGWQADTLTKDARSQINELARSIKDTAGARSGQFGAEYANDQQFKEMDEAIKGALEAGDKATAARLISAFQGNTTLFSGRTFGISEDDLKEFGFTGVMAREDAQFNKNFYQPTVTARNTPGAMDPGGVLAGTTRPGWEMEQIRSAPGQADNPIAKWFDFGAAAPTEVQSALKNLLGPTGEPESPQMQAAAMSAVMEEAQKAGDGLGELATRTLLAANAMGDVAQAAAAMQLYQGMLQQVNRQIAAKNPTGQAVARADRFVGDYNMAPSQDATGAVRAGAVTAAIEFEQQTRQQAQQYIANLRMQQEQEKRMVEDHNTSLEYAEEDHTRAMDRAGEDYRIQRERAIRDNNRQIFRAQRDFNKQMRRAAEDGARAMYDPYTRIQVAETWDAPNLVGNLKEQNDAIARQLNNLARLREQGGSSNLIKLMGLNDPKNAQQLAQLVDDAANDPRVIGTLNRAAAARQQLGGQLVNDRDNTQVARSREDFQQQLKDANEDFRTALDDMSRMHDLAVDRAEENRQTFLTRTAEQHTKALDRLHKDIQMANEVITGDLQALTEAMGKAVNGQLTTYEGLVVSSVAGINTALDQLKRPEVMEVLKNTGAVELTVAVKGGSGVPTPTPVPPPGNGKPPAGNQRTPNPQPGAAPTPGGDGGGDGFSSVIYRGSVTSEYGMRKGRMHEGIDIGAPIGTPIYAYAPGRVVFAGTAGGYGTAVYLDHGKGRMTRYGHMSMLGVREGMEVKKGHTLGLSGNSGRSTGPHLHFEQRVNGQARDPRSRPFAAGGIAMGPMQGMIAEAGHAESVIPLNASGAEFMADVMARFVNRDDANAIRANGGTTYVTYDNRQVHHDNRTIIEHVDLKAETPRELVAEADRMRRRSNLTSPAARKTR